MLVGWGNAEGSLEEEDSKELQDDDFWGWGGVFPLGNKIYIQSCYLCLSVCLFVCPIITHKPLDRFASNFVWGTRLGRMILAWF